MFSMASVTLLSRTDAIGTWPVIRRAAAIGWMTDYIAVRPRSALGNVPPAIYVKLSDAAKKRCGQLELPTPCIKTEIRSSLDSEIDDELCVERPTLRQRQSASAAQR